MKEPLGIYIHVPFCASKCAYCDFYSFSGEKKEIARYVERLISEIRRWGGALSAPPIDTLYFGGGTPSILSSGQIKAIIDVVKESFSLINPEITLEANPADQTKAFWQSVAEAGVNRVSLGVQSAVEEELHLLSRRHRNVDVIHTVAAVRAAGISNISFDLMLGIPSQTEESLMRSLDFSLSFSPCHISTYLLSLEKGTPLFERQAELDIPTPDTAADLYLAASKRLKQEGYQRYEISNFAIPGFASRHNTKYWLGEEYLGFGPSAHSFLRGKRFYYPREFESYLQQPTVVEDGSGGDLAETVLLRLRLADGLSRSQLVNRFPTEFPEDGWQRLWQKAAVFQAHGLVTRRGDTVALTDAGAVVSNAVIAALVEALGI